MAQRWKCPQAAVDGGRVEQCFGSAPGWGAERGKIHMARRVIGPTGSRRRRWLFLCTSLAAIAALVFALTASATGPIGTASGFEDDDGNLAATACSTAMDWNCFSPVTWT